ncbi:MAG: ATP-binding protein [Acidobacteria bacterium]|nr:ATP-binding protein [Acidobacteriota bacterium]
MNELLVREAIRQKIADSVSVPLPNLTRRDIHLPAVPRKVRAVTGMRRAGKTCFLFQCMHDRLDQGAPRDSLVYFSFEDERLAGMDTPHLAWVLDEYFLRCPSYRDRRQVTFFFDEIQVVPKWESFVRRIMDSEKVEVFVSGSSAKMLSREVATSLRGRATETIVHPFSFREYLRHNGVEAPQDPRFAPKARRSELANAFLTYLRTGGFPEAQGLDSRDRMTLLQSYVDACLFRDVVERHNVTNVPALRWLVRRLLGSPGGQFSVLKYYRELQSSGVAVSKDSLHAMLGHLEDAFLVRTLEVASASLRQRQSRPRKAYPVDPGLIPVFDRTARPNTGHALENAVMIELERRGYQCAYVVTPEDLEVDFLARQQGGQPVLIQVAASIEDPSTAASEFRALHAAAPIHQNAKPLLITLDSTDLAGSKADPGVEVRSAWEWFLSTESETATARG